MTHLRHDPGFRHRLLNVEIDRETVTIIGRRLEPLRPRRPVRWQMWASKFVIDRRDELGIEPTTVGLVFNIPEATQFREAVEMGATVGLRSKIVHKMKFERVELNRTSANLPREDRAPRVGRSH